MQGTISRQGEGLETEGVSAKELAVPEPEQPKIIATIDGQEYERCVASPEVQDLVARSLRTWEQDQKRTADVRSAAIEPEAATPLDFTDYAPDEHGVLTYYPPVVEAVDAPEIGVYTKSSLADDLHGFELCYGLSSEDFYQAYLEDGVDGIPGFERQVWATTYRCWLRLQS